MQAQNILLLIFSAVIIGFLVLDLGYFNRKAHRISATSAFIQSLFWVALALGFSYLVYYFLGKVMAVEFLSAYVTEKMLSVDNLFVILLIFNYFKLEEKYFHRVLFWGILGAIIFRGLFILIGAYIVAQFHFVLYFFGAVLLYTGFKLLTQKREHHKNIENTRIFKLAKKYLPVTDEPHMGKFILKINGKRYATVLMLIVIIVESTDIVFAIDSIPAAFAISPSIFILFTSNVFAIMGLRALFFLIENIIYKFHHLQKALSFVLIYIGAKMFAGLFDLHISSMYSFGIIMGALGLAVITSLLFPKKI